MSLPNQLIGDASHYIGECFDIGKPFLDYQVTHTPPLTRFVSAQLFIDNVLTGESILILLSHGKFWDTEILLRTIYEGSMKFAYILENRDASEERANEYYHVLTNHNSVKRSNRLEAMLEESNIPDEKSEVFKKITISEEEQKLIRDGTNKSARKSLEDRWSFNGLLHYFSNLGDPRYTLFKNLTYQYGMASHLIHKDGDGIGMVWERSQRSKEEKQAIQVSQSARILGDLCQFAGLRLSFLLNYHQEDSDALKALDEKYADLFEEISEYNKFNSADFS
jgi:hypothetical protein